MIVASFISLLIRVISNQFCLPLVYLYKNIKKLRVHVGYFIVCITTGYDGGTSFPIKTRSASENPLVAYEDPICIHYESMGIIRCRTALVVFDESRLDGYHPGKLFGQGFFKGKIWISCLDSIVTLPLNNLTLLFGNWRLMT